MKTKLHFFLIMLLPVVAVAVASCQDDDEWQPTWALPIVKEQTITIGDFIDTADVKEVNNRVKEQWDSYVKSKFTTGNSSDTANVDSIAFAVLVNKDSTYVTFEDGKPALNDSTKTLIKENLETKGENDATINKKISQINDFLEAYWKANFPQTPSQTLPMAKARPLQDESSSSDGSNSSRRGGDSAVHSLLDAMIHPTDVFITAANLLSTMGSDYLDSVNNQIDSVLQKANMMDTIAINFAEYADSESISSLDIYLDIASDLPFEVTLSANFIGANGDSIGSIANKQLDNDPIRAEFKKGEDLKRIVAKSTGVKFSVSCRRKEERKISEGDLRTLSQKNISFSLRVKIQAPMKLDF
jgi:hypothetical protein